MTTTGPRTAATVDIGQLSLFRLDAGTAAPTRRVIAGGLAALVAATPGGQVRVSLRSVGQETVEVTWTVGAPLTATCAELAGELSTALRQVGEVAPTRTSTTPPPCGGWLLRPGARSAPIGFHTGGTTPRWSLIPDIPPAPIEPLLGALADHPGCAVHVTLQNPGGETRDVHVQVRATCAAPGLPLSLRVALLAWDDDLTLDPDHHIDNPWTTVTTSAAHRLVPVPAVDHDRVTGMTVTGPAPLPTPAGLSTPKSGGVRLGRGWSNHGAPRDVVLSAHERNRHLHVLGRTGTGKSSLLAAIAHAAASNDEGMMVLDPHGHLVDRILSELPVPALHRTWLVRSDDLDDPVRINPLAIGDPGRREIVIQDLCAMFGAVFDPEQRGIVGPRFEERLAMLLRTLVDVHGENATLLDVPRLVTDITFQREARAHITTDRVRQWWLVNDLAGRSSEHGDLVSWFNSKFERFTGSPALRAVLGSGANDLDLRTAMDQNCIVLVDLSRAAIGETSSRTLGMMHLSAIWSAALTRNSDDLFTVLVDEAHTFTATSMPDMLAEGRKFGLALTVAHQFVGQLEERARHALTGNVGTTIAFRTGNADAEPLARTMGGAVTPQALTSLPDLTAICHRTAGPAPAQPFTMRIDHNDRTRQDDTPRPQVSHASTPPRPGQT